MIQFIQGDLFASHAPALVNRVNTVGIMGKGIALQFKDFFPHNFEVYRKACASGELKVGGLLVLNDYNMLLAERTIINLPAQTHWRLPSEMSKLNVD